MTEKTLSDEWCYNQDIKKYFYYEEPLKKAIKRLKEEIIKNGLKRDWNYNEAFNKIFGEKLT